MKQGNGLITVSATLIAMALIAAAVLTDPQTPPALVVPPSAERGALQAPTMSTDTRASTPTLGVKTFMINYQQDGSATVGGIRVHDTIVDLGRSTETADEETPQSNTVAVVADTFMI